MSLHSLPRLTLPPSSVLVKKAKPPEPVKKPPAPVNAKAQPQPKPKRNPLTAGATLAGLGTRLSSMLGATPMPGCLSINAMQPLPIGVGKAVTETVEAHLGRALTKAEAGKARALLGLMCSSPAYLKALAEEGSLPA